MVLLRDASPPLLRGLDDPLEEEFLGAEPPTGKVPGHDRFQRLLCADRQEMAQRHCVIDVPCDLRVTIAFIARTYSGDAILMTSAGPICSLRGWSSGSGGMSWATPSLSQLGSRSPSRAATDAAA